jgi:hypothetical protein
LYVGFSSLHATEVHHVFLVLGPPESVRDWTNEPDIGLSNQSDPAQSFSKKNWRLLRCQNGKSKFLILMPCTLYVELLTSLSLAGLRIFEELLEVDYLVCPGSNLNC